MSTELAPLFSKTISKHYGLEVKAVPSYYDKIFDVQTMTGSYSDDQLWETYRGPMEKLPLTPVPSDSIAPSFSKRYIPVLYALGDAIAEEHWRDDPTGTLHRVLPARGGALARTFVANKERIAAYVLGVLGFASTTPVAGSPDGQPLFSLNHPLSIRNASVTAANRPSNEVDLSYTAYDAMRANLVQQMAPNNYEILANEPAVLVVNPQLHRIATLITKNDMVPDSTYTSTMNVFKTDNVTVVEWPYWRYGATGWNAWFVLGRVHYLKWYNRTELQVESDYDIDVLAYKFVAWMRHVCGWTDWRGTYGSYGV